MQKTEVSTSPAARHQSFSSLPPHLQNDSNALFAANAADICHGIQACLEIVNTSNLLRESAEFDADSETPLLDQIATERLLRFATASAGLLAHTADRQLQWLYAQSSNV